MKGRSAELGWGACLGRNDGDLLISFNFPGPAENCQALLFIGPPIPDRRRRLACFPPVDHPVSSCSCFGFLPHCWLQGGRVSGVAVRTRTSPIVT